ncbi:hypothetical protein evm_003509 [Chilo suppressalis]|nr:hypothetical protein evm_003509 [Chilo suppressalis]
MQGSPISPLLFGVYTSQINNCLTDSSVRCLLFADDIVLYSVNKDVNSVVRNLNNGLSQIQCFYNSLNLAINIEKSGAMIFSRKHVDTDNSSPVLFNNVPIRWLNNKKFLGIHLDSKLTFELHINHLIKSASQGLNILRSLAGVHWGSDPKILSMLYKSIVRSHFDYSSVAYMNTNVSLLRKLDIIQNRALRIITGAMCSTPINAMEAESCIVPLKIRRLQIVMKFCLKLLASDNNLVLSRILPSQNLPAKVEWEWVGPRHQRWYERITDACLQRLDKGDAIRQALQLLASAAFGRMLAACTALPLHRLQPPQLRRHRPATYTLLPPREEYQQPRLEVTMYIGSGIGDDDSADDSGDASANDSGSGSGRGAGGGVVYVAPEDSAGGALLSLTPHDNALNLVYCDAGAASFTRYLSRLTAPHHPPFYLLTCTYSE